MLPTRAPEGDGEVALAFLHIGRHHEAEHSFEAFEERGRQRLRHHVVAHGLVDTRQRTQLFHPMRIRQEPTVEHDVDIERQAVFVSERHDLRLHTTGRRVGAEHVDQPVAQLVHVQVRGVDDDVGLGLDGLECLSFTVDRIGQPHVAERVPAAGRLVALDQRGRRRLEKQNSYSCAGAAQVGDRSQQVLDPGVRGNRKGHVRDRRPGSIGQLPHFGDQGWRQVVDHEPPEVLEHVGRVRAASARVSGDHDELTHRTNSTVVDARLLSPAGVRPRANRPGRAAAESPPPRHRTATWPGNPPGARARASPEPTNRVPPTC